MAYDQTIRDNIFRRLGFYVGWWYDLQATKDTVADLREDGIGTFLTDDHGDLDETLYGGICDDVASQVDQVESLRQGVVSAAADFLASYAKDQLDIPYSTPPEVLEYLIDQMGAQYPEDTVLENIPAEGVFEPDVDNSVISDDLPEFDATELARDNHHFSLVCADDSTVDGERWTLSSDAHGEFGSEVATEEAADWEAVGISDLTIPAAPAHDEDDDEEKVTAWSFSGATRGTHTDEDGRIYLKLNTAPSLADENDELGQVSTWSLTAAIFGDESDPDGKLHVSVVKEPSTCTLYGGQEAELDQAGIILDGASADNTNDGTLYGKVLKAPGTEENNKYTVELYDDAARTNKVASGEVDNVYDDADLPVTIPLSQETGPPASGLEGEVVLNAFDSTLEDADDSTIVIQVPRYFVRLHRDSGRADDDLVSEGVSYSPSATGLSLTGQSVASGVLVTGTPDLDPNVGGQYVENGIYNGEMSYRLNDHYLWYDSGNTKWYISTTKGTAGTDHWYKDGADVTGDYTAQGSYGGTPTVRTAYATSGTVNLAYVQDDEDIELVPAFYTVDAYRADPDDPETTDDDIVARAGSTSSVLGNVQFNDLRLFAVNGSGLDSATVDLAATDPAVSDGYVASAVVGYKAGDTFIFETNTIDNGRFQTFIRENYDMLFPSSPYPTIPEQWAGAEAE